MLYHSLRRCCLAELRDPRGAMAVLRGEELREQVRPQDRVSEMIMYVPAGSLECRTVHLLEPVRGLATYIALLWAGLLPLGREGFC